MPCSASKSRLQLAGAGRLPLVSHGPVSLDLCGDEQQSPGDGFFLGPAAMGQHLLRRHQPASLAKELCWLLSIPLAVRLITV